MSSTSATNVTNANDSNLQGFDGLVTMQPVSVQQMQPSYAAEFPIEDNTHTFYGGMLNFLGALCGFIGSIPICPCFPNPYKKVEQGYVGLISQFDSNHRNPASIYYDKVFGIADVRKALIERTQTTLRHTLGTRVLQDCIENREAIAYEIKEIIDEPASNWGVKVESILIKDIEFSRELQESLSSAAQAKRIGESKVIAAQAEVDAAKLMRQAAELLNSPAAMQIRYLETMSSMSKASGTKVIFMPYSTNDGSYGGDGSSSNSKVDPVKASVYERLAEH
ncbi:16881_t:CDS:2 [Rhizophagus irregularis]|nr:16881_t:CDS:2 [Rhizophagus irregularis]